MSNNEWTLLHIAKSYEEAKEFATAKYNVCQYRRSDFKNETKYIYKIKDEARLIPLGKRKTAGRPKNSHGIIAIINCKFYVVC